MVIKSGNPTRYYNGIYFTWEQGRQLKRANLPNGKVVTYQYNENGIRIGKKVGNVQTTYLVDANGTVLAMRSDYHTLIFSYDSTGRREGFSFYNGSSLVGHFYYLYNAQGDVTGILDGNQQLVVSYSYDSWGKLITCTTEHPFYSPVKGWMAAYELRAGDILVTVNGEYVVVEYVEHEILENPVTVHNFEVEDFHTYYVGDTNVLVHNRCTPNRVINVSKSESSIWKELKNAKNGLKTSGSGRSLNYYSWDNLHNEIELFDRFGRHLGVLDPSTGQWIKKAVKGRWLKL